MIKLTIMSKKTYCKFCHSKIEKHTQKMYKLSSLILREQEETKTNTRTKSSPTQFNQNEKIKYNLTPIIFFSFNCFVSAMYKIC